MCDGTGRKARLLGSGRVHGRQGGCQRVHRAIEHGGIHVQRAVRAAKLAHGTLRYQFAQGGGNIARGNIQRRNNIGSRNRQRLQCQPRVDCTGNIPSLERRI